MLKKRIAATVVVKDGIVVQSIGFQKYLPVGKPPITIEFLNNWGIDEIILLDITATAKGLQPNFEMIRQSSKKCFVPLTVGGGINNISDIENLMACGADKISINHHALNQPEIITRAAKLFGDQCVVASIDAIRTENGYRVFNYLTRKILDREPAEYAKELANMGAGEILINSVDRDGSYLGFDIELIKMVCNKVFIPVICSGGAKNAFDFIKVFNQTNASAATASNFFHFSEHCVQITKAILNREINIRLKTQTNYLDAEFDKSLRLSKKQDHVLEDMLFVKIENEVI